jgi:hypothetical protein
MPKQKQPPTIANPAARAQLEAAASAAGLNVQQLADLVFEAGVTPPKAPDGVTTRYSLKDLGERLWGTLQVTPRDERATWFAALVPVQQIAIIAALRDHGFRSEVIARDLGIGVDQVMRTWNIYAGRLGEQVVGIRLDTIAGQLQLASEHAQEMAVAAGDHRSYWQIEREKIEVLQSIGIVDKAINKTEVVHKIDDEQKAEIERLYKLRDKQQRRKIEVQELAQLEDKGEALPEGLGDKDYDDDD